MTDPVDLSRSLLEAARRGPFDAERVAGELADLAPFEIAGEEARIAFWLNLYNAGLLHELGRHPRSGSLLKHRRLFRSSSYRVGAYDYSLDVIEHGLLRLDARPPYAARRLLADDDPRRAAMPARLDPRIHFALNCGAVSCPPIVAYGAAGLDAELERGTSAYMRAETVIDHDRGRITLPYLMRLYRADFGGRDAVLAFARRYLQPGDATWLRDRDEPKVAYGKFDWTLAAG